jgi:membrane protease YdiL (CAAX protease family)
MRGGRVRARCGATSELALLVLAGYYVLGLVGAAVLQGHEARASQTFAQLTPHTALELLVWIAVAISAGFCEEFVFRGYLQAQCRRLTGSTAAAVVIQALIFGAAHGSEGWAPMLTIVPIALFFGAIVAWRRSQAPTMIGHGAADSVGTIVSFFGHVTRRT